MTLIETAVNALPSEIINYAGKRYVAGNSLQDGIDNICRVHEHLGYFFTFDRLGEDAKTVDEANRTVDDYITAIEMIASRFDFGDHPHEKPVSISVKPSSICCVYNMVGGINFDERTPLKEQLEKITREAAKYKIDVTLDMEDSHYTEITLETLNELWQSGTYNLGGVLQACLNRTKDDLAKLTNDLKGGNLPEELLLRMRSCRGIYCEPKGIAVGRKEAKLRLVNQVGELSDAGGYLEIATHDKNIIAAIENESLFDANRRMREFQFLLGVPVAERVLAPRLLDMGEVVRFYGAVEFNPGDSTPYVRRRLIESPGMIVQGGMAFVSGGRSLIEKVNRSIECSDK
jgi:proline dehydrogenase